MKRLGLVLVAFVFSVFGASAFADAAKIGVVDLQKIMQTSSQIKEIQKNWRKNLNHVVINSLRLKQALKRIWKSSNVTVRF